MKTQNNIPTTTIEVPSVLRECLTALAEIEAKISDYYPKSKVTECVDGYAFKFNDAVNEAAFQISEMIKEEVVNDYYFKNQ